MISVRVRISSLRSHRLVRLSRVPIAGETVKIEDQLYKVTDVCHNAHTGNTIASFAEASVIVTEVP